MKRIIFAALALLYFTTFSQTVNTTLTYSVNAAAKASAKVPVLIMLHGYGSNESDLFEIARGLDGRFVTFSLRAPYTTKDGGFCWYPLEFLPDQQFKYDYNAAAESRAKILSFISHACKAYKLDSTQVFIMGFSQGAIMAYDLAIKAPTKIKGIIALSGRLMEESQQQKTDWLQVDKVKIFIAHGNSDNVIKIAEAEKANAFFKEKNIKDLTYKNYEMPHSINGKELNDLKAWLVKAITPPGKKTVQKK
jgi:phospholipase/carboxylesterase